MEFIHFATGLTKITILGLREAALAAAAFARDNHIAIEAFVGLRQEGIVNGQGTNVVASLRGMGVKVTVLADLRHCPDGPYGQSPDGTLLLSLACPFPIDRDLFDRFHGRVINLHVAPLPEWRGGGGFSWMIMSGARQGGVTFHVLHPDDWGDLAMFADDGPIVRQHRYDLPHSLRTPADYEAHADEMAANPLRALLADLHAGQALKCQAQDGAVGKFMPRLSTRDQAYLDWDWPGEALERFILAFSYPYPGAMTFVQDQRIRIFDASFQHSAELQHPFIRGVVFDDTGQTIKVACSGGFLIIRHSNIVGGRRVTAGERFYTPSERLDDARRYAPVYSATGLSPK